jgi:hypothetical protein
MAVTVLLVIQVPVVPPEITNNETADRVIKHPTASESMRDGFLLAPHVCRGSVFPSFKQTVELLHGSQRIQRFKNGWDAKSQNGLDHALRECRGYAWTQEDSTTACALR